MTFALILFLSLMPNSPTIASWDCTNTVEIRCGSDGCTAEDENSFTPFSVSFDEHGMMSVCAYTGCWEGTGKIVHSDGFLVLTGKQLEFSTNTDMKEDILIALDKSDNIAMLKAGSFSHPMVCKLK